MKEWNSYFSQGVYFNLLYRWNAVFAGFDFVLFVDNILSVYRSEQVKYFRTDLNFNGEVLVTAKL